METETKRVWDDRNPHVSGIEQSTKAQHRWPTLESVTCSVCDGMRGMDCILVCSGRYGTSRDRLYIGCTARNGSEARSTGKTRYC